MNRLFTFARLAVACVLLIPVTAGAQYLGSTVEVDYRYPDVGTTYVPAGGPLSAAVGPGVEFGFFGASNNPTVDVSDTNILISYPLGFGLDPEDNGFDGIVVRSISPGIPDIISVSLVGTNIAGTVGLSFDADNVYIDQDALSTSFPKGAFISVDVQFGGGASQSSVDAIESKLDTDLDTNVSSRASQASVDAIETKLDSLPPSASQSSVDAVEGKLDAGLDATVSSRASEASVDALAAKLDALATTVADMVQQIEALEVKLDNLPGSQGGGNNPGQGNGPP